MLELVGSAIVLGWPVLVVLFCLLVYFQFGLKDPQVRQRAVFKTFIGIIAALLALMAIENFKVSFFGNSRLVPVSLVLITALAFMMGIYFKNIGALLKIGGFMFLVAAALSGYGNWLPQVEGGFPPPEVKLDFSGMSPLQLADEGEKIIFGGIGQSRVQGAIGKGQCPLCHGFNKGFLSERAPNLFGIADRSKERLEDPRYSKGNPEARDTVDKEAFPGAGTAETVQEYIAESHACPSCFVVEEFGLKGSNDRESQMPRIHKPPISLTLGELAAVDTWMYVREGKEPPTFDEILASYEKFIPEADRPKAATDVEAPAAGGVLATGEEVAGPAEVDIGGREHGDAPVPMVMVVPREERTAVGRGDSLALEAPGEAGVVLQGLELGLGERVVVRDARAAERSRDAEVGEELCRALRRHRGSAIRVECQDLGVHLVLATGLLDQVARKPRILAVGDHPPHRITTVEIQ